MMFSIMLYVSIPSGFSLRRVFLLIDVKIYQEVGIGNCMPAFLLEA